MNPRRKTPIVFGIAAAIALAACGSGSTATKVGAGSTDPQRPSNSANGTAPVPQKLSLPTVDVLDTSNDQKVAFSSLLPAAKPILFWFWAPH